MRKNKKLFAILTLVAFMMTLMPVLAFGATTGDAPTGTATAAGLELSVYTGDKLFKYESNESGKITSVTNITTSSDKATIAIDHLTVGDTYAAAGTLPDADGSASVPANKFTVSADNIQDCKDAFDASLTASATVTAAVDSETDSIANVKVTLTLAQNLFSNASYTADVNSVASGTITIAAGAKTGSVIVPISKTASLQEDLTVTVTDAASATKTTTVDIPASGSQATSAAWTAWLGDKTNATKFAAFKTAQAASPLTGADASKAAFIATCTSAGSAADYFAAGAAYDALKANVTRATLTTYKTAFANVKADKLAEYTGVNENTLKQINETNDLETVAELVATGSTGLPSTSTPSNPAVVGASIIATADANVSIESAGGAKVNFPTQDTEYAEVEVVFKESNGRAAQANTVYIWAEESGKSNQASDALVVSAASPASAVRVGMTTTETTTSPAVDNSGVYKVTGLADGADTVKVAFLRGGTYTIKASFVNPLDTQTTGTNLNRIASNVDKMTNAANKSTVTVTAKAQNTRLFVTAVKQAAGNSSTVIDNFLADGEKTENKVVLSANTVATSKVTLTVYGAPNNAGERSLMTTYPVRLSTNSANIELDKTSVTTDYKGEASFNVAGLREGEYKIYVTIGDYEATILVQVGATSANEINLIKFPSNPIATDTMVADYDSIFQFQLMDANGNIVAPGNTALTYTINGVTKTNGGYTAGACAATDEAPDTDEAKYVAIVKAPESNKVKDADLYLKHVSGEDYYTLAIDNNKSFSAEGDYEIRVVLDNGKSVTLNFSVKKFDKATSLHIEYPTQAVELNSRTAIPDIYFLDANNVMKKANNRVTVAAQGYAVASVQESGSAAGRLTIKNDEKYVGQTITVTAASDKENLMASTTLTVADEAREVKLDTNRGPVNANNRVGFKVVDSTGRAVALGNEATVEITAVVTNTGDADAKVSYSVSGNSKADLKSTGTGIINLSSNKETTATVQIMVKVEKPVTNAGDNNTGLSTTYYSGTETFTFGAEADKSVVMTIGSKEIVAQNVPVTIDVAPFIQDNRTYVPFRALVEAFGAEVDYNADNNTVTTKLDGKTVVLTVGSTVLTVNDETVTMDVAPFIVDDRVVVPVRFVGEAFGFTVEATQDADTGATASVVFYQK